MPYTYYIIAMQVHQNRRLEMKAYFADCDSLSTTTVSYHMMWLYLPNAPNKISPESWKQCVTTTVVMIKSLSVDGRYTGGLVLCEMNAYHRDEYRTGASEHMGNTIETLK